MSEHVHVESLGVVGAPADEVWATVADFGSVARYLPSVAECRVEGDGVGARRFLTLADGGRVVSELIALDPDLRTMAYRIVESALPFSDYESVVRVEPHDERSCIVTWTSQCRPGDPAGAAVDVDAFLRAQLESGIAGLRTLHEPRADEHPRSGGHP